VAAGLAKVLNERGGIRATIRPFSGSSVYLPMLERPHAVVASLVDVDPRLLLAAA
jgi:hypothetical protein